MQVMQEQMDACNAIMTFGYMDSHSSHSPQLNHGCKIECLKACTNVQVIPSMYEMHEA